MYIKLYYNILIKVFYFFICYLYFKHSLFYILYIRYSVLRVESELKEIKV